MAGDVQPGGGGEGRPDPAGPGRRLGMRICSPFGIPVYVSPYWFVVAAVLVVLYSNSGALPGTVPGTAARYLVAIAFVVLLYLSVLVHELCHSLVARGFALPVSRIQLYPLGGFSEIAEEPKTAGQEFLVSAVGPAMSLALGGIGIAVNVLADLRGVPRVLVDRLILANFLVGVFNLLPGLPLDGGRMLRAAIWKVTGKAGLSTELAAQAGRLLALAIVVVALAGTFGTRALQVASVSNGIGIWLVVVAGFMWMNAGQTLRFTRMRQRLPAIQARALARRAIPIPPGLPLAEAIRRADLAQARALVVVDNDAKPVAIVSEGAVINTPEQRRPWVDAGSLARTLDPDMVLSADLSGIDLVEAVQRAPATEYLLVEPSGQVYGVLATADLDRAFLGQQG